MKSENVKLGMLVWVRGGSREPALRDRIGIVRKRVGNRSYSPFEVHFVDKQQRELLWASEFEVVKVFYEHYG
jgi:hypothetical protein